MSVFTSGGMEVIVEEGAVMSEDDETPNRCKKRLSQ